jgi:alpha-glucosidase
MEETNEQSKEIYDNASDAHIEEEHIQHLNNPVTNLKPIVKKYLTAVQQVVHDGNKFYFSDGDARVEIRIVSDEIIR